MATISIDITKDLTSASALKAFLTSQGSAILAIEDELAQFAGQPIASAVDAPAAKLSLSAEGSWNLPTGVTLSLTPTAACSVSVAKASATFEIATKIDSPDPIKFSSPPIDGKAFVNIQIDFGVKGSVQGSGMVGSVQIGGSASAAENGTFAFCQPVDASMTTVDALKQAFSKIVFPAQPDCGTLMDKGAISKLNFDGSVNVELDVSYGLGDHKFGAPSVAATHDALKAFNGSKLPQLDISGSAKASVGYAHEDHFAVLVNKTSDSACNLYLVRSAKNEWDASVGISAGITATKASVSVDSAALQTSLDKVTGNSPIGKAVANAATQGETKLQDALTTKLNGFLTKDVSGKASLTFGLDRQAGHTTLFDFKVDLTNSAAASESWQSLLNGDVRAAMTHGGFTLQAGSGVSDQLQRSSTIDFQFFNFGVNHETDFFNKGYAEVQKDGSIRISRDIGVEEKVKTKTKSRSFEVHFLATADEKTLGNVAAAAVDLLVEFSETKDKNEGASYAHILGEAPLNASGHETQAAAADFVNAHPDKTLAVSFVVKPSAYGRLQSSPYVGGKPNPDSTADRNNWNAFKSAARSYTYANSDFLDDLTYDSWVTFNRTSIDGRGSTVPADRRQLGNPPIGPQWPFFVASAEFMNLCDDLRILAGILPAATADESWTRIVKFLGDVVNKDIYVGFAKAIAAALLDQCQAGGPPVSGAYQLAADNGSLTCTLTVS